MQALKSQLTSDLARLKTELSTTGTIEREKETLVSYQLEESEYEEIDYDSSKLTSLRRMLRGLQKEEKQQIEVQKQLSEQTGITKGKLETAEKEVEKAC